LPKRVFSRFEAIYGAIRKPAEEAFCRLTSICSDIENSLHTQFRQIVDQILEWIDSARLDPIYLDFCSGQLLD